MNDFYRNASFIQMYGEPSGPEYATPYTKTCRECKGELQDQDDDYCDECWKVELAFRKEQQEMHPEMKNLRDHTLWALLFILAVFSFVGPCKPAHAETINVEKLADAIYLAEGGKKANVPYGIHSVDCNGEKECRKICINTIKNNIKRWEKAREAGYTGDYLTFLGNRYAPPSAHPLNKNWIPNVKRLYKKAGA